METEVFYCPKCDELLSLDLDKPNICECGSEVYRYGEEEIEDVED